VEDPAKGAGAPQAGAQRQEAGQQSQLSIVPRNSGPAVSAGPGRLDETSQPQSPKRAKRRRRKRKAKKPFTSAVPVAVVDVTAANANAAKSSADSEPFRRADLYAALDLGTNNCRLLIAAPTRPGQFRVVDAFSRIVRLGEGLTATGHLSEAAMDRAVEALKICADKLGSRTLRKVRLIATEACRSASNGANFIERVGQETGLALEIVDRETEARLAVSGCGPLVSPHVNALVLFDIGGGSSEIALIDRSKRRSPRLSDQIAAWTSLPVGVVSLAERFGGKHVTPDVYNAMVADVLSMIEKFEDRHALGSLASGDRFHLLGTSGTVTTLAGIHLGLARYDRRRVDGLWMQDSEVEAMSQKLQSWTFEERVANACIGAERADLVLAGCAILDAIRQTWPSQRMRVADRGLREGILSEMMSSDGAWRRQSAGAR
jgi:exopolyphosphatase / guanosine-5'-triphosphate,3'-diphosphate pyrophosphatase